MGDAVATSAKVLELGLVVAGVAQLWRRVISPRARASRPAAALQFWEVTGSDLVLFLAFVAAGGIGLQLAAVRLAAHFSLTADSRLIAAAAGFQAGMLAGVAAFHVARPGAASPRPPLPAALATGAATFLVSLPVLALVALVWQNGLDLVGLPVEQQDLMDLFVSAHSRVLRAVLVVFAVIIAPVTEELIFRRGIFRFLRGRVPRWVALWAPALLFGALHVSWGTLDGLSALAPLVVLGVVFSIAYERTGRIGTAIVAHALFNLNTVVLVLAGVNV